jgi:hypothetical protein
MTHTNLISLTSGTPISDGLFVWMLARYVPSVEFATQIQEQTKFYEGMLQSCVVPMS